MNLIVGRREVFYERRVRKYKFSLIKLQIVGTALLIAEFAGATVMYLYG